MSPDEEEKSEEDASEAQGAPVAETAAPAEQPSAEAGQSATADTPASESEPPAATMPVAEAEQPGTAAEPPSAEAGQTATADAPASESALPAAAAPAGQPVAPSVGSAGFAPRSERRSSGPPERGGRHFGRRKFCTFCVEKAKSVDYKDPSKLRRFVSDRGRIEGRRRTGVCAKHQRWLAVALKRARHLALLPYTPEHIRSSGAFPSRR